MQDDDTALVEASKNDELDVVKYVLAHKADVNAKDNNVITALSDGLFASLIVLMMCDAAVVCAEWLHRANTGVNERSP